MICVDDFKMGDIGVSTKNQLSTRSNSFTARFTQTRQALITNHFDQWNKQNRERTNSQVLKKSTIEFLQYDLLKKKWGDAFYVLYFHPSIKFEFSKIWLHLWKKYHSIQTRPKPPPTRKNLYSPHQINNIKFILSFLNLFMI